MRALRRAIFVPHFFGCEWFYELVSRRGRVEAALIFPGPVGAKSSSWVRIFRGQRDDRIIQLTTGGSIDTLRLD